MAVAFGVLGLAPAVFWAMTPRELDCALRGRFGPGLRASAPTRADVAALMKRFPDMKEPTHG